MTIPKRKVETPTPVAPAPADKPLSTDKLGPTEVAVLLGKRYQYTRDLMLSGAFGKPEFDSKSPKGKLTVTRAQVLAYLKRNVAPAGPPADQPSAP